MYMETCSGADPGCLERGFAFLILSHFSYNFVSLRPNYINFIGSLKTGTEGGSSEPPEPPLDPPLVCNEMHIR